jgi:hypothetical protein
MSYPPPPPGAPVPPADGSKPRLRGRIPLRLAIIFLVLGVAGMVIGGVVFANGALKKVDDFQRITVPTSASGTIAKKKIDFGGTGGFIAYYESKNATTSGIPAIPVRLTSPSGTQTILSTPYGGKSGGKDVKSLSYDYNGHKGVALWQFSVKEKGTYTVEVAGASQADPDAKIALGRSIGKSTAVGASLLVVGVLLLIAGIILLIIGLVKRSRSKKELAAAQAYYSQQGGYGQPQPGYGQPAGYGAPGQQPPAYGGGQTYGTPPPPQGGYPPPGQQPPPPPGAQEQNPWPPQDNH